MRDRDGSEKRRRGTRKRLIFPPGEPGKLTRRTCMTMPSDAADAIESTGPNEGPRDHEGVDTDHEAYVDDDNVPHPGDVNEAG
jgi:hypothetical protein